MMGMHPSVDLAMDEGLLEIDEPLEITQDMLYNRGPDTISGSFLSEEQDKRSERVHAEMMSDLNEVCDMEKASSKNKRVVENGVSTRSGRISRSHEETSVGMYENAMLATCGQRPGKSGNAQSVRPKHLCEVCGKTFKRAHNLKIHGRLHSGDKPYACPFAYCPKEFRWKSSIVSHLNWHRTKKGDVLPGNFSSMRSMIMKKKKRAITQRPTEHQKQMTGRAQGQVEEGCESIVKAIQPHELDTGRHGEVGAGMSEMVDMGDITGFTRGLGVVGLQYENRVVEKEEKDDATVLTPSTTSYQASPVALEMGELDCLPVLDEKEWETRSEGGRSGLSGVLLPSLSCCRIENDGDGFGSFLEEQ